VRLLVRPDTILRWHRDLLARRHAAASRPRRRGRPPTVRSIRRLVLRLVADNPSWGYRRVHGELLTLGIKVAASTVWEMLREAGIDPAPDRTATTWTQFLRSQADALLATDFIETITLTGARMYVLAHALHEYEMFYNNHRPHQGIANARPLAPLPQPITDPDRLAHLTIHRHDHLGGVLPHYQHAA
jgi:transposase